MGIVPYKLEFDELFTPSGAMRQLGVTNLRTKYLSVNFTDEAVIDFNVLFLESEFVFL